MKKIERIGVGVDFREKSGVVLESAATLAHGSGAALDLIHVVRPPNAYSRVLANVRDAPDVEQALEGARRELQGIASGDQLKGIPVSIHVGLGVPEVEVPTLAHQQGADVLLVGPSTRHRSGWFGVGRTAGRIVQHADVPVLIAKQPIVQKPALIVATTDFSDASRPALVAAVTLAREWGSEVLFLHVLEPLFHLQGWSAKVAGESDIYAVEPAELEPEWDAVFAHLELGGVRHRHETIKSEDAVDAIVDKADAEKAGLLVTGTHGRTALSHVLLGSTAEAVVDHANCPVLTVRSDLAEDS